MDKGQWKERYQREHWTKRIDISFLYQLETMAARMKKRAEKKDDKELLDWAYKLRLIVARINGEELNIPLSEHRIKSPSVTAKD